MAYLSQGGEQGQDNSDELANQTELLEDIKDELVDQGTSLDSLDNKASTRNTTLANIKTDTANLSAIATNTANTVTEAQDIEAELVAQGVVQDGQKLLQQELKSFIEESKINQEIMIKHLEILTSTIIKKEDILC